MSDRLGLRHYQFIKKTSVSKMTLHKLTINKTYSLCHNQSYKWWCDVKFIKVSASGYNLLNVATGQCVLTKTQGNCKSGSKYVSDEELSKCNENEIYILLPSQLWLKFINQP